MQLHSRVTERFHAWTLERYLTERFRYLDAVGWGDFIRAGKVLRAGEVLHADTPILTGDIVTCIMPDLTEPTADLAYRIVYEDQWLLGIDKPGNLLVHRRGKCLTGNLIYQIRFRHEPAFPEADIVNRLDRCTSGVVLLSRDRQTLACMNKAFASGEIEKVYWGIVHGLPHPVAGCIDFPIGRIPREGPPFFGVGESAIEKKEAMTGYRLLRNLGDDFSLIELRPRTGRTHQLRVHLSAIGHPLVGDALYQGVSEGPDAGAELFHRQALHCAALHFRHPGTGEPVTINAPLPQDMDELCMKLAINSLPVSSSAE